MKILLRVVVTAVALWVATFLLHDHGLKIDTSDKPKMVITLLGVAVIFGVVNALLKPIIKTLGCALYALTLGLFALVVNALLLELTSAIAKELKLPFQVDGFWPAFWGAIIVGVVSWLLNMVAGDD